MIQRSLPRVLLILLALIATGGVSVWWLLQSGFEPGGGGAVEHPTRQEADGTLVLRLRLNVWGGGGDIEGRYRNVALVVTLAPPNEASSAGNTGQVPLRVPGRIAPGGSASTQWYEFRVPPGSFNSGGQLAYHYEVTFDGRLTQIPGRLELVVP